MRAFRSVVGGFLYFPEDGGIPEEFVCAWRNDIPAYVLSRQYLPWIRDWEEIYVATKQEAITTLASEYQARHVAELIQ